MKVIVRLFSMLLAAVLLFQVSPQTAVAATTDGAAPATPTRTQPLDVTGIENTDMLSSEGWKWEKGASENTLTFHNFYLKADATKLLSIPDDKPVHIVCEGYNVIESTEGAYSPMVYDGTGNTHTTYYLEGSGTIEFKVTNPTPDTNTYVFTGDNVIIDGCTLKSNIGLAIIKDEFSVKSGACLVDMSYAKRGGNHRVVDSVKGPISFSGGTVDFNVNDIAMYIYNQKSETFPNAQFNITGGNVKIHSAGDIALLATNMVIDTDGIVDLYGEKTSILVNQNNSDIQILNLGAGSHIANNPEHGFKPIHVNGGLQNVTVNIAPADYSAVEAAIDSASALVQDNYQDFTAVTEAIDSVDRSKNLLEQDQVDQMAQAINDAIAALEFKPADYSAVDAALDRAAALDENAYVDFSAVEDAIAAVVRDKDITEQDQVDQMAQAINDAIDSLEFKPADYSAVDAALDRAAALDENAYVDFSAVEDAIAAVVRDKDITEQDQVDQMAQAINDAIDSLEKKPIIPSEQDNPSDSTKPGMSEKHQSTNKGSNDKLPQTDDANLMGTIGASAMFLVAVVSIVISVRHKNLVK